MDYAKNNYEGHGGPEVFTEDLADGFPWENDTQEDVYASLRCIKDPEFPIHKLGDLRVVQPAMVTADEATKRIGVQFVPTVKHCTMAPIIGLCLRQVISRDHGDHWKVKIAVAPGSHDAAEAVTKQLNDKERVAAALENEHIAKMVENAIRADEWA